MNRSNAPSTFLTGPATQSWAQGRGASQVGPFVLLRALPSGPFGRRWLGRRLDDMTAHVIHLLHRRRGEVTMADFRITVARLQRLDDPHLLTPAAGGVRQDGRAWIAIRYTGDRDGLLTLPRLVGMHGGWLPEVEILRLAQQLLSGMAHAHSRSLCHGSISPEEVLIDRRGRVAIELYGLRAQLDAEAASAELRRVELRSLGAVIDGLLHGSALEGAEASSGQISIVGWRRWLDRMNAEIGGFQTPEEALAGLPRLRSESVIAGLLPRMSRRGR